MWRHAAHAARRSSPTLQDQIAARKDPQVFDRLGGSGTLRDVLKRLHFIVWDEVNSTNPPDRRQFDLIASRAARGFRQRLVTVGSLGGNCFRGFPCCPKNHLNLN